MPDDSRNEKFVPSQVFDLSKEEANRVINDLFSQLELDVKASGEMLNTSGGTELESIHKYNRQLLKYLRLQLGMEDWADV